MKTLNFKSKISNPNIKRELNVKYPKANVVQVKKVWPKKGQMAFMNLFMGLIFAFMILATLTALIPAFREQILSAVSYSSGLNCVGAADYNATAAGYTGGTSTTACLALGLFIPFLVLAVIMALIGKMLYDRGAPAPGYG